MSESGKDPRDEARAYKESGGERPSKPGHAKTEAEWRDAVSEAIEKAMREGEFEKLPGKGKPLNLEPDPFAPEGVDSAWRVLKNNDLAPGWIGARGDLLRDIEAWRGKLQVAAARWAMEWSRADTGHQDAGQASAGQLDAGHARWLRQQETIREEIEKLNRRIRDLNLQQPVSRLEVFHLRIDEELRRAGFPEEPR